MISRTGKAPPPTHLPLRRLALCLDCDECFEIGASRCPACGSATWTALARFIDLTPSDPIRRLLQSSEDSNPKRRDHERRVARQLLIVARNRTKLYEYVQRAFAGNETVQVMLDRRVAERRQRGASAGPERRQRDRRGRFDVDNLLRALGWAIVMVDLTRPRRGVPNR
jgi:hypothetical protein